METESGIKIAPLTRRYSCELVDDEERVNNTLK